VVATAGEGAGATGAVAADAGGGAAPADVVATVLAEEARREGERAPAPPVVLPDDLLPGVGDEDTTLREALRVGGTATLLATGSARLLDGFDHSALSVLAPDVQRSLGASDAVMGAIGGAFGVLFLLGSIPVSTLADRHPRKLVAAVSMALWSVVVGLTAVVQTAFWLFVARLGTGISQSYALPVNAPLLVDTYPISARSRVVAAYGSMEVAGRVLGPLFAGGVAGLVAGPESWRWVFAATALLGAPVVLGLLRVPEPRRGGNEMRAVLGEELPEDRGELPIPVGVAFERLRRIRSFHFFLAGMAALGFALFSIPLFLNLHLEDELGLSAGERGVFGALVALPGVAAMALVGPRADRRFRRSPPSAVVFVGGLIGGFGVCVSIGLHLPGVVPLGAAYGLGAAMAQAALVSVVSLLSSVIPYRLRSRGTAMVGVYLFLCGGFAGAVLTGLLTDALGRRGALTLVVLPSTLIGGALIAYGARYIRGDISRCVEELLEERAEAERLRSDPADTPAIQVRNLDFSYGSVQVLFGIDLDVARGETVALLGTNGAGKSTLLRVISGLGVPTRGVVRLHGRTVTYCDPELRARIGIVQLMGGNAVFGSLSVDDNLRMASYLYRPRILGRPLGRLSRLERATVAREARGSSGDGDGGRRVAAAYERFPELAARRTAPARDLSGGQQQMLALAMALLHEPEVLIVDELSLGLAPVMVQQLLATVRELQAEGLTMILVEQSLNVALSVADRAVFMEKGQVRFDGPARELAERDDLARAVFLGAS
jgi:ABC-type branched-subunit amino acid transport system ATPase component/predicted MFS family arabinose efflux permease